jgi:hypothetical protein
MWVDGRRIKRSSKRTDQQAARDLRDELLGKRSRGEFVVTGKWPSCSSSTSPMRTANSRAPTSSRCVVKAHLLPGVRASPLRQAHRAAPAQLPRASQGQGHNHQPRAELLSRARKGGLAVPIPPFPKTREDNARQGFVNEPVFPIFLDELPCVSLRGFAVCAYYGGMRRGELLRLRLNEGVTRRWNRPRCAISSRQQPL